MIAARKLTLVTHPVSVDAPTVEIDDLTYDGSLLTTIAAAVGSAC